MTPKGLAKAWARVLGPDLAKDEQKLIMEIANFIVARWHRLAQENPNVTFRAIYLENKAKAQGLVCAAVEASRAVAAGRDPREEMVNALDKGMVCQ